MSVISIIIPVYNKEKFIRATLESVARQTFSPYEVIMVNDGSSDSSGEICKEFAERYEHFHYFEQENQGVIIARNNAISYAAGTYIFPLDADDSIREDCLQLLHERQQQTGADVVYCDVEVVLHSGDDKHKASLENALSQQVRVPDILLSNMVVCSALYSKKAWERYGGYSTTMTDGLEDWDFWLNFVADGARFEKVEEKLFCYNVCMDSGRNAVDTENRNELYRQVIRNHRGLYLPYKKRWYMLCYYRTCSLLKFIPYLKRKRKELLIYRHVRRYWNEV